MVVVRSKDRNAVFEGGRGVRRVVTALIVCRDQVEAPTPDEIVERKFFHIQQTDEAGKLVAPVMHPSLPYSEVIGEVGQAEGIV